MRAAEFRSVMASARDVLKVQIESDGQVVIARLLGSLDEGSQAHAESLILPLLMNERRHLLIEASELSFVSSAGLRVIIGAVKAVKPLSGTVSICAPQPSVEQLLRIAGLTALVKVHPSLDAARVALLIG
jgi:anti-sigma B factor antagonist